MSQSNTSQPAPPPPISALRNATGELRATGARVLDGVEARERYCRQSLLALRCMVLKHLTGLDYRGLSKALAMSPLYRWFCGCLEFEVVRVPAKSTLQNHAHWLPAAELEQVLARFTQALGDEELARLIGLENELDLEVAWVDGTCLKANIHFPVDWVLLRDGARTLIRCIQTIRRHGLKHRIAEPGELLSQINSVCMGLTAGGRKPGAGKERKRQFRVLKRLGKVIESHGRRYRRLLDERWQESDLSRKEAEVILRRIENVLEQLPEARRQAHERIIGQRQVRNKEKILSLYEPDVHVIVRGKAGAEIEFGNKLFVVENADGFIIDHDLQKETGAGDARWLEGRYELLKEKCGGRLCGVVGDRGFQSAANSRMLEGEGAFDGLCPRNPRELRKRLKKDEAFEAATRRRAQTEGRIGILKNVFLDGTPRAKGYENRRTQVAWAVLAHNLWVAARRLWPPEAGEAEQAPRSAA